MTALSGLPGGRTLAELDLHGPAAGPEPDSRLRIRGITADSRRVEAGWLFVAVPGTRLDGAGFVPDAMRRGAAALVTGAEGLATLTAEMPEPPVPVFVVPEPRVALAELAARFYGAQPEVVAAVTGTNGKTSVVHFLRQIWRAAGHAAASLGTTGVTAEGFTAPLALTSPDPAVLHAMLARLAGRGVTHAALEASSHGLVQHRLDGVRIAAAGFTNLSRDHLDYHESEQAYLAAKLRLFAERLEPGGTAVTNIDDPAGQEAERVSRARDLRVIRVGRAKEADLAIIETTARPAGQRLRLGWAGREYVADLGLIGTFQAENVAVAAGLALATGVPEEATFSALESLRGAPGRMEPVARRASGARIFVDYAHTPDALATAIAALRPHCGGRLIVVFGAGGDRDPGKRPLMGRAVARGADVAIVTDDNPRTEDPATIRRAILAACPDAVEIPDRRAAILAGVDMLKGSGDCLLIAGKGHEQGQIVGETVIPFDDAEAARAAVAALDGAEMMLGGGR